MANTLRGLVKMISPTKQMNTKSGQPFSKRDLILDCTRYDPYTGQKGFENTPSVSFMQDKCALLDAIHVGDVVEVSIDISGRYYADKDAYYNDIRGYKVEVIRAAQQTQQGVTQQPSAAYAPQYAQQPQPVPQNPAYAPAPQYPPQADVYAAPTAPQYPPQPQYSPASPDPNTGLPF